jgi:hypothetical protein
MKRQVSAHLDVDINADTILEFQIAVAPHPGTEVYEALSFTLNGKPIEALEVSGLHGNRIHKFGPRWATSSRLRGDHHRPDRSGARHRIRLVDVPVAQSVCRGRQVLRLCRNKFGAYADSTTLLEKVSSWVGTR